MQAYSVLSHGFIQFKLHCDIICDIVRSWVWAAERVILLNLRTHRWPPGRASFDFGPCATGGLVMSFMHDFADVIDIESCQVLEVQAANKKRTQDHFQCFWSRLSFWFSFFPLGTPVHSWWHRSRVNIWESNLFKSRTCWRRSPLKPWETNVAMEHLHL